MEYKDIEDATLEELVEERNRINRLLININKIINVKELDKELKNDNRIELKDFTKEYWQGFQDGQISTQRYAKEIRNIILP